MDTKRVVVGTIVGGITMYLLGILIFGLAAADIYAANGGGAAREAPLAWAIAVGTLSLAALVTLAIGHSGASGIAQGFKVGAIVGFLVWFGVDFIRYGNADLWNVTLTIVDPLLEIVRTGLGGVVIALVLARMSGEKSGSAPVM